MEFKPRDNQTASYKELIGNRNVILTGLGGSGKTTLLVAARGHILKSESEKRTYRILEVTPDYSLVRTSDGYPIVFRAISYTTGDNNASTATIKKLDVYSSATSVYYKLSSQDIAQDIDLVIFKDGGELPIGLFDYISYTISNTGSIRSAFQGVRVIIETLPHAYNEPNNITAALQYDELNFINARI